MNVYTTRTILQWQYRIYAQMGAEDVHVCIITYVCGIDAYVYLKYAYVRMCMHHDDDEPQQL